MSAGQRHKKKRTKKRKGSRSATRQYKQGPTPAASTACLGKHQTHLRSLSQVHVTAAHKEDNLLIKLKPPASSAGLRGQAMRWSLSRCLGPFGLNEAVKRETKVAQIGEMMKLLAFRTL